MNKRGVVLIICYMVIVVLSILGAAFLMRSISERSVASSYYYSTQALWLAEAGIQQSLWELNYNNCAGCVQCDADKCISDTLSLGALSGDYQARILNGNTQIVSVGSFPNTNPVQRTVYATLIFPSVFKYGIFSQNQILFSNSASIDSYDSSKGNYNVLLPDGNNNVGAKGGVATNSDEAGAIELDNTSHINGDVGVGGDPETGIVADPSAITGIRHGDVNIPFPSVPEPTTPEDGWLPLSSSSLVSGSYSATSLTLNNKSPPLNINGDVTLYITGNVDVGNFAALNVNLGGKLTLYVNGTFNVAQTGTINNITKIPGNFTFYSRYSGTDGVSFNNNTALYGLVYAPDTKVSLAQSFELYGALVGESTSLLNSTRVHYDEALKNTPTPFTTTTYSIQDWRERQNNDPSQSPF